MIRSRGTGISPGSLHMNRRSALGLGALSLLLAGCGPARAARSGEARAVTYLTPAYEDVFPGIDAFVSTAGAKGTPVDLFDSGALLNADQLVPGLMRDVADVIFQTSSYVSASYPILGAYELPFVSEGYEQVRRALAVEGPLHNLINAQIQPRSIELLATMPTTPQWIFTVDRPVQEPTDVRGLRIRTAGHVEGQTIRALGGSPVSMSSAELYEALERGTIDGMVSYMGTVISRDLQGILKYGTEAHFGCYSIDAYSNRGWYTQQSSERQTALNSAAHAYSTVGAENMTTVHGEQYRPLLESSSMELITLDSGEIDKFTAATESVVEWWKSTVGDYELAEQALKLVRSA